MALRPDLVPSTVAQAPSVTARDLPEFFRLAARPEWPGYVGAPRYATPDLGRRILDADTGWNVSIASRLLDGEADERQIARAAALMQNPDVTKALGLSMQRDAAIAKRQQEWIAWRALTRMLLCRQLACGSPAARITGAWTEGLAHGKAGVKRRAALQWARTPKWDGRQRCGRSRTTAKFLGFAFRHAQTHDAYAAVAAGPRLRPAQRRMDSTSALDAPANTARSGQNRPMATAVPRAEVPCAEGQRRRQVAGQQAAATPSEDGRKNCRHGSVDVTDRRSKRRLELTAASANPPNCLIKRLERPSSGSAGAELRTPAQPAAKDR